jgi:hypothetical protein
VLRHPKNPRVRRIWILAEVAAILVALGWFVFRMGSQPALTVDMVEVGGFNEDLGVWMRYSAILELTNGSNRTLGIERITVEPDLDAFNEAYGHAVPYLTPPLLIERNSATRYTAVVTLLNAAQLPERTYDLVLRVSVETEDGDTILREYSAQYDHSRNPAQRRLRRR